MFSLKNKLAHNASWMLLSQVVNFGLQAAFFVLIARFLGVVEYGAFAGALALVSTMMPYSAGGSAMLFMRYGRAGNATARVYWGNALVLTTILSVGLVVLVGIIGPAITGTHDRVLFISLVVANCLFGQIVAVAASVFQTFENMRPAAVLALSSNAFRLTVLLMMRLVMGTATASQWAIGVLLASIVGAVVAAWLVSSEIGPPRIDLRLIWRRLREGFGFSFAGTTQAVYNDVDKTMLCHFGMVRENGFYSLAYRLTDFVTAPINAIDSAVLPRYFRLINEESAPIAPLVKKAVGISILLGLGIAAVTTIASPLVVHLTGNGFSGVVTAMRWLCWLPLFRGIHQLTGSALTASGHQSLRTVAQFTVAAVNLLLNFLWIPHFGWIGAAWSSVACDGLLGALNAGILIHLARRISSGITCRRLEAVSVAE